MTTGRKPQGASVQTSESTKTKTTQLSPLEEKVVRMRHGLKAPNDMQLESLTETYPDLADELQAIERNALETVAARSNPTKRKIIGALRSKKQAIE